MARKGKTGGYQFAKALEEIHLNEIIDVVEGWESYDNCILGFHKCSNDHPCTIHEYWSPVKKQMMEIFQNITLRDVVKEGLLKF